MLHLAGIVPHTFLGVFVEGVPTLRSALRMWRAYLEVGGSPATTIGTYLSLLKPLDTDSPVSVLTPAFCMELVAIRVRAQKPATARTYHDALCAFSRYLVDERWLLESPMLRIPKPKVPEQRMPTVSRQQLRAIYDHTHGEGRLILLLLLQGLRASELLGIRWSDVREDRVYVVGKGHRPRSVPLDGESRVLLQSQPKDGVRVFQCGYQALYIRVRRWGVACGMPWLRPHILRHTWSTEWMRETHDMDTLRVLGGWSPSSKMPSRYARAALEDAAVDKAKAVRLSDRLLQ